MPEPLAQRLKMDLDTFSKAVEKLIAQGAATIDLAGNVRATPRASKPESWRAGYDAQIAFRRSQIDRMSAFAETQQCRMTAVIRHFGDTADAHRPCGKCDFCSPSTTSAQTFAEPTPAQARDLRTILAALAHAPSCATGKLHTDLALGIDRKQFDVLLDALARAGLITLTSETFINKEDGRTIQYKKAALTHEGRSDDASELTDVVLPSTLDDPPSPSTRKRAAKASSRKSAQDPTVTYTPAQQQLDDAFRTWRKSEAAKTGKPAFIVLSDTVIRNLAIAQPRSIPELLTVSGIGPEKAERFGADIIAISRGDAVPDTPATPAPRNNRRAASPRLVHERTTKPDKVAEEAPLASRNNTYSTDASAPTFRRVRPTASDPTADLTPEQQLLDAQLRAWRKAESARIGLPQFFVLGSSTLRSIVLLRPRTIAQLQAISGIGPDKAEQFGAAILSLCSA
jgi:ATP-dependent DNA helicase RecQ